VKQTTDHQALAISQLRRKILQSRGGHAAEAAAPQIDGDDKGIESQRQQYACDRIALAQQPSDYRGMPCAS